MPPIHQPNETYEDFLALSQLFWPRIVAAVIGGGLIGAENQIYGKSAGLRTSLLVTLACCVITIISIETAIVFGGEPGRISAQIVTGIGFLGGGVILQQRGRVTGLTTAASIFVSAGIGIVAGSGFVFSAVAVGALAFVILLVLRPVDYFIDRNPLFLRMRKINHTESWPRRRSKRPKAVPEPISPDNPN